MEAYTQYMLTGEGELSPKEIKRAKRRFRHFFYNIVLPSLFEGNVPGGRRARSQELAERATIYFFEPGGAQWLEDLFSPEQTNSDFLI